RSADRNATDLAAISRGVAAVSEIDGMLNSGAGPGFGPTANVKAPRTGGPSTEVTRQGKPLGGPDERGRIRCRAPGRPGPLLVARRIRDGDHREPRLHRFR